MFLVCIKIRSLEPPPSASFTCWTSPEPAWRLTWVTTIGSTSQTALATYGRASMYPSRASASTMPSSSRCVLSPSACSLTLRTCAPHYGELVTQVVTVADNEQRHTRNVAVCRRSSRHHVQVACIAVGRSTMTKEGRPSSKRAWPAFFVTEAGASCLLSTTKSLLHITVTRNH